MLALALGTVRDFRVRVMLGLALWIGEGCG